MAITNNGAASVQHDDEVGVKGLPRGLSLDALARRRMLLTSLGKGSAVVAASAAPLKLLAGQATIGAGVTVSGQRCSISGQQSGVHSQTVGGPVCTAHSPGYWHKCNHWLAQQTSLMVWSGPTYPTFKQIFSGTVVNSYTSLPMVALLTGIGGQSNSCPASYPTTNLGVSSSNEWHWACAWMNAVAGTVVGSGIVNFPYSPAEVIAFYNGSSSAAALAFFKSIEGAGFGGPPN